MKLSNIVEAANDYSRCDIVRGLSNVMSSQTLIIQHPASGGADCEQAGRPRIVVELLNGESAGLKAAIPMLPILMDQCKGMSTGVVFGEQCSVADYSFLRV